MIGQSFGKHLYLSTFRTNEKGTVSKQLHLLQQDIFNLFIQYNACISLAIADMFSIFMMLDNPRFLTVQVNITYFLDHVSIFISVLRCLMFCVPNIRIMPF